MRPSLVSRVRSLGVLLRARTMTYARAGHTPLIYVPGVGAGPRDMRILAPDGMVVGLKLDNGEMFERLLKEDTIQLHPGDLLGEAARLPARDRDDPDGALLAPQGHDELTAIAPCASDFSRRVVDVRLGFCVAY